MADCGSFLGVPDPVCNVVDGAKSVVGGVAGSVIDQLADKVTEAVGRAVASVGTLWVNVGTPNLTSSSGGSTPSDTVGFLQGALWWYMAAAAVLSVIVAGARMAWEGRAEPGRELVKGLLTLVVVAGAGLTAISLLVAAADGFAKWLIDESLQGTDFGTNVTALLGLSAVSGLGAIIVIVLGLVAFLAAIVQIMFMVVRGGMLVILAGIFPLSASATSTEWGRTWFKRCVAWLVAFILYKPAAAIVYATAFRLSGSDLFGDDGLTSALTGLMLMILAVVALPALMRFVTPMVAAMASGGGGGGGAMAVGAMAAMPTGAMRVPRGSSSAAGGGVGPSGGAGPSGAAGTAGDRVPAANNGSSPAGSARNGAGVAPTAAAAGNGASSSPGGAAGAGAAAGSGAAAGGAAAGAGAVAGPVGAAAAAGAQTAKGFKGAAQGAAESQTGDEGPRGSR
jgi:hypothetical protein